MRRVRGGRGKDGKFAFKPFDLKGELMQIGTWSVYYQELYNLLKTMSLSVGTKAPAFTLKSKSEDGLKDISPLENSPSKNVVLLFFPLAFTSVCADEMCSVRDSLKEYESLDAAVYGISVDSPFSQEVFAKEKRLNFPLLSDFNRDVSKAYDVLFEDLLGFKGVSKRAAFVINKAGEIVYASDSNDPKQLPDFEAMKKVLAES